MSGDFVSTMKDSPAIYLLGTKPEDSRTQAALPVEVRKSERAFSETLCIQSQRWVQGSLRESHTKWGEKMDVLQVNHVSKQYGEKENAVHALRDVSFRVGQGEFAAIVGTSGSGKSTLLKLLLGWLPDYGGAIRFDGKDAKDFTPGTASAADELH